MSAAAAASVRERLAAGPRRGLGCAREVAAAAVADQRVLRELVGALGDERAGVQARAANALKKVQKLDARALDPFAGVLLPEAMRCEVPEARWNLLLVLGGLHLRGRQKALAVDLLLSALGSTGALERVHALAALVNLSAGDPALKERVRGVLERMVGDQRPSVRARARCFLRQLTRG